MVATYMNIPAMLMIALSVCMAWVVLSDAKRYIISNALNIVLIVIYIAGALLLPIPTWLPDLGAAALVLVIGLGFFTLGLMGGGDIKLLVVLSLWTGWAVQTLQFVFLTAIFGGLLVILVLLLRAIVAPILFKMRPTHNLPRLLTRKQPIPYGIAIAAAFTWLLWTGSIAGLTVF